MTRQALEPVETVPETPASLLARSPETSRKGSIAFPIPLVLFLLLVLFVALNVGAGWKVMTLEYEKARFSVEKAAFEVRLEQHEKILKELPELQHQAQDLSEKVSEMEGRNETERKRFEQLTADLEKARRSGYNP